MLKKVLYNSRFLNEVLIYNRGIGNFRTCLIIYLGLVKPAWNLRSELTQTKWQSLPRAVRVSSRQASELWTGGPTLSASFSKESTKFKVAVKSLSSGGRVIYCGEECVGGGGWGNSMIDSPASRTINSHFCCLFIPLNVSIKACSLLRGRVLT